MHIVLLAVLWWPFHHTHVVPPVGVDTPYGVVHFPDRLCDHSTDGYFFTGPDGMVGVSPLSCDAAFSDWSKNTGTPVQLWQI